MVFAFFKINTIQISSTFPPGSTDISKSSEVEQVAAKVGKAGVREH